MNNFFLLNEAIEVDDFNCFIEGMSEIIAISKSDEDRWLNHESIWGLSIVGTLYTKFGQNEQVIVQFLQQQLSLSDTYIADEQIFDNLFPDDSNAFLGIDFSNTEISLNKQIINVVTHLAFKNAVLWDFSFRTLWIRRKELFPNIELCGIVEQQIARIGDSSQFNQIVERLKTLDDVTGKWKVGDDDFNYRLVNRNSSLRISPESDQTMASHGTERLFSLPNGDRKYFELHIKTGNFRFHFYPDNTNRLIYVGYIGQHLTTISG